MPSAKVKLTVSRSWCSRHMDKYQLQILHFQQTRTHSKSLFTSAIVQFTCLNFSGNRQLMPAVQSAPNYWASTMTTNTMSSRKHSVFLLLENRIKLLPYNWNFQRRQKRTKILSSSFFGHLALTMVVLLHSGGARPTNSWGGPFGPMACQGPMTVVCQWVLLEKKSPWAPKNAPRSFPTFAKYEITEYVAVA